MEVIKAAAIPNDELTKELEEFGCTIPNCETTEWLEEAYQTFDYGISSTFSSKITVQFSSSRKVGIFLHNENLFLDKQFQNLLFFGPWLIYKSKEVVESKKEKIFWLFLMIPYFSGKHY